MLSIEHGVDQKNISKMVHHYQQKNGIILAESITVPIMERKKKQQEVDLSLKLKNEDLKRQLKLVQLKLKGYQIMGDKPKYLSSSSLLCATIKRKGF